MAKNTAKEFVVIGVVLGFLVFVVSSAMLRGFVFTKLGGWFVVPLFDVPQLSTVYAIGIALLIGMFYSSTGFVCWLDHFFIYLAVNCPRLKHVGLSLTQNPEGSVETSG